MKLSEFWIYFPKDMVVAWYLSKFMELSQIIDYDWSVFRVFQRTNPKQIRFNILFKLIASSICYYVIFKTYVWLENFPQLSFKTWEPTVLLKSNIEIWFLDVIHYFWYNICVAALRVSVHLIKTCGTTENRSNMLNSQHAHVFPFWSYFSSKNFECDIFSI